MIIKVVFAFLGISAASPAWAMEQVAHLEYRETSRELSVSVGAIPVQEFLTLIADAAGIRVRVRGDLGAVRAQSFDYLPLDVAIQRLFRSPGRSLVMLYEATPDGGQRLAEVRLSAAPATLAKVAAASTAEGLPATTAASPIAMPPPPMHIRPPPPPPPPPRTPQRLGP